MASSFEEARKLWSTEGWELPASEFQSRFDALYATAEDLLTLWQLGGAAGDYLRLHPGSVHVPESLPDTLLASEHVDARIVGLKLLNRLARPSPQITKWIGLSLGSKEESELMGALHELGEFLPRAESSVDFQNVKKALAGLSTSSDCYVRERAADFLSQIE